jgi:hypothetical protein
LIELAEALLMDLLTKINWLIPATVSSYSMLKRFILVKYFAFIYLIVIALCIICRQTETGVTKLKLQRLSSTAKSVKDTQKLHNIVAICPDVIEWRMYGDATSKWTVFSEFLFFIIEKYVPFCLNKNMYKHW